MIERDAMGRADFGPTAELSGIGEFSFSSAVSRVIREFHWNESGDHPLSISMCACRLPNREGKERRGSTICAHAVPRLLLILEYPAESRVSGRPNEWKRQLTEVDMPARTA
jgi:hypothetical protein